MDCLSLFSVAVTSYIKLGIYLKICAYLPPRFEGRKIQNQMACCENHNPAPYYHNGVDQ